MAVRELILTEEVPEKTTVRYRGTFVDEDGSPIPSANMTTITLTMYLKDTAGNTPIGTWTDQSVLDENGGTFGATDGILTLYIDPADTAMVDQARSRERHQLDFAFTYNGGARTGRNTALLIVKNYGSVT